MNFSTLAPIDIRDYAKSLGWSLLPEAVKDRLFVLVHPDMAPRQIVIPANTRVPDYAEAVQQAMEKLAVLHGMSVPQVVGAVQTVRADTLRYRITSARGDQDTLPLPFAASFVQGAQQMLLASACTVLKPQVHHPRLHRAEAQQLLENARFGQTEQGSFVLKVSCPINALDMQASLPLAGGPLPFVRMTTIAIKRALQMLVDAVETDTLDQLAEQTKKEEAPLLSSNLGEAVTRLHDDDLRNAVELSCDWAAGARLPAEDHADHVIRIEGDYFPRIASRATIFPA